MDLSICTPTYRGAERVGRLLESVNASDEQPAEVVIADDGSPPEEYEALRDVLARLAPHTKLVRSPSNRGCVATSRRAVELSTGRLVLMCDDDATIPHGLLLTLGRLYAALPLLGVLSWRSEGHAPGQSAHPIAGFLQPATQLAGYCMAFPRALYDVLGGFDPRFRTYCGDSDFALRATLAGRPCYRVWWPLVPHEEHGAFRRGDLDRRAIAENDLAVFTHKWGTDGPEMERRALGLLEARAGR